MRDIAGYGGAYAVSSDGMVWSRKTNRVLKQHLTNAGYLAVDLSHDGVKKRHTVHRLVALAYVPNPNNLPVVNHLDSNKLNNEADNLEWTTVQNNTQHGADYRRANGTQYRPKPWKKYRKDPETGKWSRTR